MVAGNMEKSGPLGVCGGGGHKRKCLSAGRRWRGKVVLASFLGSCLGHWMVDGALPEMVSTNGRPGFSPSAE